MRRGKIRFENKKGACVGPFDEMVDDYVSHVAKNGLRVWMAD